MQVLKQISVHALFVFIALQFGEAHVCDHAVLKMDYVLIMIVAQACYIIHLVCAHLAKKSYNEQKLLTCYESLAFYYFVQYRALQIDSTPIFFELQPCNVY